ncbi:MAG: DDE-type integrase/transposase/recombinase [Alphaproteobacteria bacterium]|nr:DDE-type integrase/transposase/recombinase [Alphaproteobacteria bacterium]
MNRLPFEKRRQIIHQMVEGGSVRGIARLVDVSPVTVLRYLALAGEACAQFHDSNVRNVKARRVQCDEIWSFVFAKDKNASPEMKAAGTAGSVWTWTALDSDTKLIISYLIGGRDAAYANEFMKDVASRLSMRCQLTTDGHSAYLEAVDDAFGIGVDFAQLVKLYGDAPEANPERKYSPSVCVGAKKHRVVGNPDLAHVSTSHVEKHNQSMRQHMKRFARLTAAHSKKVANHIHMVALYTTWYNYARINSAVKMSPAMAAGLSKTLWDVADIVRLVDAFETQKAA